MATILNMLPVEPKQNAVPQNTSKKTGANNDKTKVGFDKVLNEVNEKTGMDVDSKSKDESQIKDDASAQFMAVGLVMPVVNNLTPVNEVTDNSTDALSVDMTVDTKLQMPTLVNADAKLPKLSDVDELMTGKIKSELPKLVGENAKLNEVVSESAPIVGMTAGMNTSQNQLAALLAKMTDVNSKVDMNQMAQIKVPLQDKQNIMPVVDVDFSKKNPDILSDNTALLEMVPSMATMDNPNGLGRDISKQLDSKKLVAGQVKTGEAETTNISELFSAFDVKPVLATQEKISVDTMASANKGNISMLLESQEQSDVKTSLPDQSTKNINDFANALQQHGIKNESQTTMSDVKTISQQPIADTYNIKNQIVDQARLIAGQKNTEMIIQLRPEHLGELTMKVTVEGGVVSASFHSNNAEVRNVIESSLYQLKQEMLNQGLKVDNVGVYGGLGQFFSDGQREGQKQPQQVKVQNKKNEEDFIEALESHNKVESVLDDTGVDYRV